MISMYNILGVNLAKDLASILSKYIFPFLTVASILWALWIAVEFFKAKDEGSRTNAKARLIKALATVAIVVTLYGIMAVATDKFKVNQYQPAGNETKEEPKVSDLPQKETPIVK